MKIYRSITEPIRSNPSFAEKLSMEDKGLIISWEVGRLKSKSNPELAECAIRNELPVLGYKGGVEKRLKKSEKFGTLNYLAQWQGLRGEDLNIDLDEEIIMQCSKTEMLVTYTYDSSKYSKV